MKPHLDIAHEGTLGDENRVRMRFDQASIAHLMKIMIDMYSNPAAAVVREYSTNAVDSHVEAGITDPIEITKPNVLNPIFVVRDHGVGLSEDEILNQFSLYGWSSKRDSDEATGMLGLGCKSALTYTPSFTMIVVKNHRKATVLVTREDDGTGAVQVVESTYTFERDGVEVRVPVGSVNLFNHEVEKFFRFWPAGSVVIDGEPNKDYFDREHGDFPMDPDVTLTTRVESDFVIMGNVAYPLAYGQKPLVESKNGSVKAVVRVPIGEIDFAPNREALQYTDRTLGVLEDARIFIKHGVMHQAQDEIDRCKTHSAALTKAVEWREYWGDYLYHGMPIPRSFHTSRENTLRWNRNGWGGCKRTGAITADDALKALHVVGHNGRSMDKAAKYRIEEYIKQRNLECDLVFAYPKPVGDPWLDDVPVVDYEVIRAIPLPDYMKRESAPKVKYRRVTGRGVVGANNVDPDRPVAYVMHADAKDEWVAAQLGAWFDDHAVTLLRVTEKGLARFMKQHPDAIEARRFVEKMVTYKVRNMTEAERTRIQYGSKLNGLHWYTFSKDEINKILDPELRQIIRDVQAVRAIPVAWWDSLQSVARILEIKVPELPKSQDLANRVRATFEKYPLLRGLHTLRQTHFTDPFTDRWVEHRIDNETFIDYCNALYYPTIWLPY